MTAPTTNRRRTVVIGALAATLVAATVGLAAPQTASGATADQAHYNAVYQLDSDDPKLIQQTLRNINNALEDARLKGKITIELVAFGNGTALFRKDQPYEAPLTALKAKGVILSQCLNTLKEKKISKDELLPLIAYVPSGNGELIIRQAQGWSLVHP